MTLKSEFEKGYGKIPKWLKAKDDDKPKARKSETNNVNNIQ